MPTPLVALSSITIDSNRSPIFFRVASSSGATVSGKFLFLKEDIYRNIVNTRLPPPRTLSLSNFPTSSATHWTWPTRWLPRYVFLASQNSFSNGIFRLLLVVTRLPLPPRCTRSRRSTPTTLRKFSSIGFTTRKSPWFTTVPPRALQKASKPVTETGICSSGKKKCSMFSSSQNPIYLSKTSKKIVHLETP